MITDGLEKRIIKIEDIDVGTRGRKKYQSIEGLADSIRRHGLMSPVGVTEKDGKYLLIYGGRRLRAVKQLGEPTIAAVIWPEELGELQLRELELEENLQRDNLDWKEEAAMTEQLVNLRKASTDEKLTQGEIAKSLGISQAKISRDLLLARAMKESSHIAAASNKSEAMQRIKTNKETLIKKQLLEKQDLKREKAKKELRKKQLLKSYIIGDFYEMGQKLPKGAVDFCELDPPDLSRIDELMQLTYSILRNKRWGSCWCGMWDVQKVIDAAVAAGFTIVGPPLIWIRGTRVVKHASNLCLSPDYIPCVYFAKGEARVTKPNASSVLSSFVSRPKALIGEKPAVMIEALFRNFCKPNHNILVPFAGSGSSLIAADRLGASPVGFEIRADLKTSFESYLDEYLGLKEEEE